MRISVEEVFETVRMTIEQSFDRKNTCTNPGIKKLKS